MAVMEKTANGIVTVFVLIYVQEKSVVVDLDGKEKVVMKVSQMIISITAIFI